MPQAIPAPEGLSTSSRVLWDLLISPSTHYRQAKFIFDSPERFESELFKDFYKQSGAQVISQYGQNYFESYLQNLINDLTFDFLGADRVLSQATTKENLITGLRELNRSNLIEALRVISRYFPGLIFLRASEPGQLTPTSVQSSDRILQPVDMDNFELYYYENDFTNRLAIDSHFAPKWFLKNSQGQHLALLDYQEIKKYQTIESLHFYNTGFAPAGLVNSLKLATDLTRRFDKHSSYIAIVYFTESWLKINRFIKIADLSRFEPTNLKAAWSIVDKMNTQDDNLRAIFSTTPENEFFNGIKWWGIAQDQSYWLSRDYEALRNKRPTLSNFILKHGQTLGLKNCWKILSESISGVKNF